MNEKLIKLRQEISNLAASPEFRHHKWFVKYHLEIVEKISLELCEKYPEADRELCVVMAWMHDYGKIIDFGNEYAKTIEAGPGFLKELGFEAAFAEKVINYIEILDRKNWDELKAAPIEVQIISSADGCSHMTGPFMSLWWYENPQKSVDELLADTYNKAEKDWNQKIVLPEARAAFDKYHNVLLDQSGKFPERYI